MSTDQPPTAPAPPAPEYEFTPAQNRTFEHLGGNLIFAGWFVILVVLVFHAVLLGRWVAQDVPMYDRFRVVNILWPLLVLYCGWQFIATGRAFLRVVETRGSDIAFLMAGLDRLNEAFSWLTLVPKVWLVLVAIAAVVGGIMAAVHWMGY
jgi:hypothetical protein